ncbi:MAG TPA: hypothetical protein VNA20_07780 [Frankiaceae bacterium]|nr:hypothetical protein [Frankiaceae bacterium]
MRLAAAFAVLAATTAGAAPGAVAAPARVCRLVTDARNDTAVAPGTVTSPAGTQEPSLDIVSADLASDTRWLTTAVRVADLQLPTGISSHGLGHSLYFRAGEHRYVVYAYAVPSGRYAGLYRVTWDGVGTPLEQNGTARTEEEITARTRVTYDVARSEVRVSVPVTAFAADGGLRPGTRIDEIQAVTWRDRQVSADPVLAGRWGERDGADAAAATNAYTAGRPSCLKPGS